MNIDFALVIISIVSLASASIPASLFAFNVRRYRPAPIPGSEAPLPPVSVLIPARDEQDGIAQTVEAVLANEGINFELIVLDDHSRDATARIVSELASADSRVRLVSAPPLPAGWSGKQHACWQLARLAKHTFLLFLDADVRLSPDAIRRSTALFRSSGADLVSGIPRQETGGVLEKLVIPLIHFILLGFLPIGRMRRSTDPSYAAGCGQLFLTRKDSYLKSGGHAAIRSSFHDGIKLPRAYRAAGLRTDLFDPTELATCRMYRTSSSLWGGLAKNASEGLAAPRVILPMTFILLMGQVLPILLVSSVPFFATIRYRAWILGLSGLALVASYYPRMAMIGRFRQSRFGAWMHPLGILVLLAIQWYSLIRSLFGWRATWKSRPAPVSSLQVEDITQPILHADIESAHGPERTIENPARR